MIAPRVLIVGATSSAAEAAARELVTPGLRVLLASRRGPRLAALADDLRVRGAEVDVVTIDVNEPSAHDVLARSVDEVLGGLDVLLVAVGTLPNQAVLAQDPWSAASAVHTNAGALIALIERLAPKISPGPVACIVVLSSVAGDLGRAPMRVYCATKAALDTYLEGLRQALWGKVRVVTVKPGPFESPMTDGLRPNLLWGDRRQVGRAIVTAIRRGRGTSYVPWFWRFIMAVVRRLPRSIVARLKA